MKYHFISIVLSFPVFGTSEGMPEREELLIHANAYLTKMNWTFLSILSRFVQWLAADWSTLPTSWLELVQRHEAAEAFSCEIRILIVKESPILWHSNNTSLSSVDLWQALSTKFWLFPHQGRYKDVAYLQTTLLIDNSLRGPGEIKANVNLVQKLFLKWEPQPRQGRTVWWFFDPRGERNNAVNTLSEI